MDLYLIILGLTLPSMIRLASGEEMCNYPPDSSITDLTAENFLVGTELIYNCDLDYFAGMSPDLSYTCDNSNGVHKWISELCHCRKYKGTTTNIDIGNYSSDCDFSTNLNESIPKDNCGPPPTVMNAKLDLFASTFPVGQELHYSFQCDDHDQSRTLGVLKCQNPGGSIAWIELSDGCINKSNGSHQADVTNSTESNGSHQADVTISTESNGSHQADVTNSTACIYFPCVCVAVGVITAIVVIFAFFKIAQWRIRSSGKSKFLQRNTVSAQKEEEINAVHVPLNEKL